MSSTFRSDLVAGVETLLNAYIASNPTLLRAFFRARPAQIGETPLAFIGPRNEVVTHSAGTRSRVFTVPVVIADVLTDNVEVANRFDDLTDSLLDYFTANPHGVSATTLIEPVSVEDIELDYGTVVYRAVSITLRGQIQEGRD